MATDFQSLGVRTRSAHPPSAPGALTSYWNSSAELLPFPSVNGDLAVDVAIVGGGLCGLTSALLLARAGKSVAVVEARRLGRQATGHTTAKITSQHAIIYADLEKRFGEEGARIYGEAQQAALEWMATQVREMRIDCDFVRKPAYVYAESEKAGAIVEQEAEVARKIGLPASLTHTLDLPYPVRCAVRFDNQAQFHPIRYLRSVISELQDRGCRLFEDSRVLDVEDGEPCALTLDRGRIRAAEVIVATNMPMLDRGGYFAKAAPYRHMVLGARLAHSAADLSGMYLGVDPPIRSVRTTPTLEGPLLIVVGEPFKPGAANTTELAAELEDWIRVRFAVQAIEYRWGNQDYFPVDRVPYVGKMTSSTKHIGVATGFQAWGMTNSTVAAMILSDEILGRHNPWAETFHATRKPGVVGTLKLLNDNLQVAGHFAKDHTFGNSRTGIEDLRPGEGGIVKRGGKEVAAYREPTGTLHVVSPVCRHLGCHVRWNAAELSWDCPCHGSRYDVRGSVLNGPTVKCLSGLADGES